ncbi:MAG: 2-amino-4-hydroxy-6-hydroxymethyldihydropteridine diphosphokinase [Thermodesulfobacteriota bacterium]
MALVFIGLGANLGPARENIRQAWGEVGSLAKTILLSLSSPYLSEPVGVASDNWFTNAVGVLETRLSPHDLLTELLAIETKMGRDRSLGHDRPVDLDILYFDAQIINDPDLTIPHPEIAQRLFVLAPLSEVAPDHIHPVSGLTSTAMKQQLLTPFSVKKSSW